MRYLLRRFGFYLVALWAALSINFLIPRLMPADPVLLLVGRLQGQVDPRAIQALRLQFGLDNSSMWSQYVRYLSNLFHGNLGTSITYFPTPVAQVIGLGLRWTLVLVGVSAILSFFIGT